MSPSYLADQGTAGTLAAALLAAHMLGDFVLQTGAIARNKVRLPWMALHLAILFALVLIAVVPITGGSYRVWLTLLGLTLVHGLIDRGKLALDSRRRRSTAEEGGPHRINPADHQPWHFALDQGLHLLSLAVAWKILAAAPGVAGALDPAAARAWTTAALVTAALAFNTTGGAVIVAGVLGRHRLPAVEAAAGQSGFSRGRTIGILERLLVLTLILAQQWGSIGLILAAKSIARFKDLESREFSEYYLIGTLLSLAIATASGVAILLLT